MIKRLFDFTVALVSLIVLSPLLVSLLFIVRIKMGSPIIFTQIRPGKNGKPFMMYKFRSMTNNRDENGDLLPNEMRLTSFGKFLRSNSLDELPELVNVIKGDMSLVGPRPLRMKYLKYYTKFQFRRHEVKPGITGWAQVNGRNTLCWEDKFKMDIWYVDNHTLALDIKILISTIWQIIIKEGITPKSAEFDLPFDEKMRNQD